MSTTKKRAELKRLSEAGKQNLFAMLRLASDILSDGQYVAQFGGEPQAVDDMEAKEFSHFGGRPPLAAMLAAFRKFPDEATWQASGYNIQRMIDLANPAEPQEAVVRNNWRSLYEAAAAELAAVKSQLVEATQTIAELRTANGVLNGRIIEIEKRRAA